MRIPLSFLKFIVLLYLQIFCSISKILGLMFTIKNEQLYLNYMFPIRPSKVSLYKIGFKQFPFPKEENKIFQVLFCFVLRVVKLGTRCLSCR